MGGFYDSPIPSWAEARNPSAGLRVTDVPRPVPHHSAAVTIVVQHHGDSRRRPGRMALTTVRCRRRHTLRVQPLRDGRDGIPSRVVREDSTDDRRLFRMNLEFYSHDLWPPVGVGSRLVGNWDAAITEASAPRVKSL